MLDIAVALLSASVLQCLKTIFSGLFCTTPWNLFLLLTSSLVLLHNATQAINLWNCASVSPPLFVNRTLYLHLAICLWSSMWDTDNLLIMSLPASLPQGQHHSDIHLCYSLHFIFGKKLSKALQIVDAGGVKCFTASQSKRAVFQVTQRMST